MGEYKEIIMNIFNKLSNTKNLTNNEKQIVDFILENPREFLNMSSDTICKECFVSTTTLYRLCQKLDISGLSELKVKISGSINSYLKENKEFDFDFPVKQNQSHYEILTKIREDYDQTILSTFNLFNLEQLKLAIKAMKKAKQIDVYTSAGNIHFAKNFAFQMKEIGVDVHVPEELYLQKLSAAASDAGHFAIVISFGGRNWQMKSICEELKENNTRILLICSEQAEKLFAYADMRLYFASYEDHSEKISSFSTRLSLLSILDMLYTCYFERDYEGNLVKKKAYYRLLTKYCEG